MGHVCSLFALGLASAACSAAPIASVGSEPTPKAQHTPPSGTSPAPVATKGGLTVKELLVPGFLPAVLLVPDGSDVRPLVAAAHGAGGSPEWECDYWARLTRERAFVLCLRGTAMGQGAFYYKNHYALRDELGAALAAARATEPRIAPGGGVYAGFSQGASMGSLMIAQRGQDFPLLVLIEGFTEWNLALGRKLAASGGKKVLFACGTPQCASKAERSVTALERAGVQARLDHAKGAGHTPLDGVQALIEQDLPWLLDGVNEWQ